MLSLTLELVLTIIEIELTSNDLGPNSINPPPLPLKVVLIHIDYGPNQLNYIEGGVQYQW